MDTGDDLVAAADAGLYVAKRAGRSQVATVDDHSA
jgi:PleD family two-component response regulator